MLITALDEHGNYVLYYAPQWLEVPNEIKRGTGPHQICSIFGGKNVGGALKLVQRPDGSSSSHAGRAFYSIRQEPTWLCGGNWNSVVFVLSPDSSGEQCLSSDSSGTRGAA